MGLNPAQPIGLYTVLMLVAAAVVILVSIIERYTHSIEKNSKCTVTSNEWLWLSKTPRQTNLLVYDFFE